MKTTRPHVGNECLRGILLVALWFVVTGAATAQEAQTTRSGGGAETRDRQAIDRAIKDLRVYLDRGKTKRLTPHTVLRWPNPVRGCIDGATAIWTYQGRPQLVYCIWTDDRQQIGLAAGPLSLARPIAELNGHMIWPPERKDKLLTRFRDIPNAPQPAKTSRQRLLQMKLLAKRFEAKVTDSSDAEVYRLLPTPIYRYELPADSSKKKYVGESTVLDGSVFAFVHGTDPETLLLIEARSTKTGFRWQFAAAARGVALDLSLDDKRAASIPFCRTMVLWRYMVRDGETVLEPVN
ncbi:MAG: hypothetical protein H8E66_20265 [Planctomycetes bacterium]|nr:hypothetical protein [Planctomycetota bacterium]